METLTREALSHSINSLIWEEFGTILGKTIMVYTLKWSRCDIFQLKASQVCPGYEMKYNYEETYSILME